MGFWNDAGDWLAEAGVNVAVTPLAGLYALGGGINELTGGNTSTYSIWDAVDAGGRDRDALEGTTYSPTTQALSGYVIPGPGAQSNELPGTWNLPILNRASLEVAGDVVEPIVDEIWDAAKTPLIIAAVIAAAVLMGNQGDKAK